MMRMRALLLLLPGLLLAACSSGPGPGPKPEPSVEAPRVERARPATGSHAATVVVGPFDLHRRYGSMQGPYVLETLRIGDLLAAGETVLPESKVQYVEKNGPTSMMQSWSTARRSLPPAAGPRRLYWFKAISLEVQDENDRPLPTAEFICHLQVDVDPAFRDAAFPQGERCPANARLITLTQGQTRLEFPPGYALPVASDEPWTFTFQAANRTTDRHRRLKHRCRLEFVADQELTEPVQALSWITPFLAVVVDRNTPEAAAREHQLAPDCSASSLGASAPNSAPGTLRDDECGRKRSGHWVVLPGLHTYHATVPVLSCRRDRILRLVWTHCHPLLKSCSLLAAPGRRPAFTVRARTRTQGGLEIEHIDLIQAPEGIPLPGGRSYEMEATYDNTTGQPQDAMNSFGMFFDDPRFGRPAWATGSPALATGQPSGAGSPAVPGGQASGSGSPAVAAGQPPGTPVAAQPDYPAFDLERDGPLLTSPVGLEADTTLGKLHLVLDPRLAPVTATQVSRLMLAGAYDGTPFCAYRPAYVLQLAEAASKLDSKTLSVQQRGLLRRLPLEVEAQSQGKFDHRRFALSMSRGQAEDSALTSFCIVLGNAHHLDGHYTLFGYLEGDAVTEATVNSMLRAWEDDAYCIRSVRRWKVPAAAR